MKNLFLKFIILISSIVLFSYNISYAGDAEAGKKVFAKCKACHSIKEGGKKKLGPNLWGIVGNKIAAVEGMKYSKALKKYAEEAGTWEEENLDKWLASPKSLVKKSKMIFPGLKSADDRANIIAYMRSMGN